MLKVTNIHAIAHAVRLNDRAFTQWHIYDIYFIVTYIFFVSEKNPKVITVFWYFEFETKTNDFFLITSST